MFESFERLVLWVKNNVDFSNIFDDINFSITPADLRADLQFGRDEYEEM